MARNTSLAVVRSYVKAESFQNMDASSTADDQRLNQLIQDVQNELTQFDWEFLKKRWSFTVSTRYTNFPATDDGNVAGQPNFERPAELKIKWNGIWQPIIYGIDEEPEFNYLDSDLGAKLDPIQRWQFYDQGQLEVWPLPSMGQEVRYIGQRFVYQLSTSYNFVNNINVTNAGQNYTSAIAITFTGGGGSGAAAVATINNGLITGITVTSPGVGYTSTPTVVINDTGGGTNGAATAYLSTQNVFNDTAVLDLDDRLVAYYAAAAWLGEDNPKFKSIMTKAQNRLMALRGTNQDRDDTYCIGRGNAMDRRAIRRVPMVIIAGTK